MTAIISKCGQYRYRLERPGDLMATRGPAVFIMLNPSTADATEDDATIRRCRRFAESWGCNGIVVVNLYALRATDPRELWQHAAAIGPRNDQHLRNAVTGAGEVICAWGANARQDRVLAVTEILRAVGAALRCLGTTKHGAPRHPLYVRADTKLVDWPLPEGGA